MGIRYGSDFTEDFRSQDLENCSSEIVFRFLCLGLRFLVQGPGFWGARLAECPGSLRAGPESPRSLRQLSECPRGLRGNGFRCVVPGFWDARLPECPRGLRAKSGVFWESRDPGGVSWSLSTILGTPRSYRSVLGVSGRPRVSESLGVLPSLQEVFFAAGHGTRLSECSRSLRGGPNLQESRELPECP